MCHLCCGEAHPTTMADCPHQPTKQEVDACDFINWYPILKKLTIASRVIALEDDFVSYLLDGGPLVLPATADPTRESYGHASEDSVDAAATSTPDDLVLPSFPKLEAAVTKAIEQLGGTVFVKLNWSAPQDAAWIARNGSLACSSPGEVFLLLKSSNHVQHDLTHAYQYCSDPEVRALPSAPVRLVLRNWWPVRPEEEFRCFVRHGQLVGVCQRQLGQHFPDLSDREEVVLQHAQAMAESIKAATQLENFVFDGLDDGARLLLVDVNPYSAACDTKLFTWAQLEPELAEVPAAKTTPTDSLAFSSDAEVEAFMQEHAKAAALARGEEVVEEALPTAQITQGDQLTVKLLKAFQSKLAVTSLPEADDDDMGEFADDDDDDEQGVEAPGIRAVEPQFAVVSAEDAVLQAATMAVHAFPRDVVEIASTQDVNTMVELMKQAQADESDDDGDDS
eukprot:m.180059 g.180059  ORF g.180059 m.180059 type:complete len:450 (-) comp16850_c0_seq1:2320-3669(-)